jgi:nucleotide-binding universal stress UspA family protein
MNFKDKNILVPIDFREQSLGALNQAISISLHAGNQIILLYINQEKGVLSSLFSTEHDKLFDKAVFEKLEDLAKQKVKENNVEIIPHLIRHNSIHEAITDFAHQHKSDLIVMGKGESKNHDMIGSNTSRVLRNSKVPILTVCSNCSITNNFRSILLPLDLTKETRQKVNWGIMLAKLFDAKIKVVSALWDKDNINIINSLKAQLKQVEVFIKKQGVKCSVELVQSSSEAKTLVPIIMKYAEEQEDIDLIAVMTQQENSFTEFFLGSSATELIRKAEVPVLSIIPHETGQILWGY